MPEDPSILPRVSRGVSDEALCLVIKPVVGSASLPLDESDLNDAGHAQALICSVETFKRSVIRVDTQLALLTCLPHMMFATCLLLSYSYSCTSFSRKHLERSLDPVLE